MIEKVSLFRNKKETFYLFVLIIMIFLLSVSLEYYHYKQLTKFDSALIEATVLKQYTKTKTTKRGKLKTYQVLKLKGDKGFTFYTTASKKLKNILYRNVQIEAWAGKISFYEYVHGFFAFSKVRQIHRENSLKHKVNKFIASQHKNRDISAIYQALFTAKPLCRKLQTIFSNLGISHLIAISGFHLGVLSAILFLLIKYPYKFLQNRYFPYRSYKLDSFIIISLILLSYLLFLDSPPSLLRAFVMLIIGFFLYDRGITIISMQTLLLTVLIILALFPRLFFNIGFWLSISGVFYIFLFFIHFKNLNKFWQFVLIPFWVYILMLPYSLSIFGNFSFYHPLSIIWTSLFSIFYPLSILLHFFGVGDWLDFVLKYLLHLDVNAIKFILDIKFLVVEIILSLLAVYKKIFVYILFTYSFSVFIYMFSLVPF